MRGCKEVLFKIYMAIFILVIIILNIWPYIGRFTVSSPGLSNIVHENCVIKGNISYITGEKIYHMPGDEYYEETTITGNRESYFCTREEAEAAGFRRALNRSTE